VDWSRFAIAVVVTIGGAAVLVREFQGTGISAAANRDASKSTPAAVRRNLILVFLVGWSIMWIGEIGVATMLTTQRNIPPPAGSPISKLGTAGAIVAIVMLALGGACTFTAAKFAWPGWLARQFNEPPPASDPPGTSRD